MRAALLGSGKLSASVNTLRIAWIFFRIGAMNELQYRVNFFIYLFQSAVALGTGLIGLWLIFSHTSRLHGWNPPELLALMGVFTLMGGVIGSMIQPNMERLIGEIRDGTFDFALTKPEDSQLLASVREVRVWQIADVLTGAIVIVIAEFQLRTHIGVVQVLEFVTLLILGALMIYSFWLILTTAAFWIVKMDEIVNLFQGVYAAGRYPVGIYPGWLRLGLTFLVPVAFAVTVPAEALTGRLSLQTFVGAVALTLLLLAIARSFWKLGTRHYSGASA
jgi:ABC-2 type transport system permease protein